MSSEENNREYDDICKGRVKANYYHPLLESVLKNTSGIILYQEQIIKIAQIIANYSIEEADTLRKKLSKRKDTEETKNMFIRAALKNGINQNNSSYIYKILKKYVARGTFLKANVVSKAIKFIDCNHSLPF